MTITWIGNQTQAIKYKSVEPPNFPWNGIADSKNEDGYLVFYYSDVLSPLPVRWITKPGDNKSDPNIETKTFGLFSTCNKDLRAGVVNNNAKYIFFVTPRNNIRVLAGYYKIEWYAKSVYSKSDYCLAANSIHFIHKPIPLSSIDQKYKTHYSSGFRLRKKISEKDCKILKNLIDSCIDATSDYIDEIDRLERYNLAHGGFRYIAWRQKDKFTLEYARKYLSNNYESSNFGNSKNSSYNDLWECRACQHRFKNKALLKLCPFCGELGTLKAYSE